MSTEDEKEKQKAIAAGEGAGWSVARVTSKGYMVMHCGCGDHQETLKKTPSNPDHFRQKARKMVRDCPTG
ncbi:MAG: hypothetical protein JWM89_611 [Acidimicrobiales bacterium]|nr:hypothetical protein [Acidimicrobiales bacterium]